MAKVVFPNDREIYIEINGKKLASIQSYNVKTSRDYKYIDEFGEDEPTCIIPRRPKHVLELSRIYSYIDSDEDIFSFYDLSNFNIVITNPERKIVYSGCEWLNITEKSSAGNTIIERIDVVANKRMETVLN